MASEDKDKGQGQEPRVGDVRQTEAGGVEIYRKVSGEGQWVDAKTAATHYMFQEDYTRKMEKVKAREREVEERAAELSQRRERVPDTPEGGFDQDWLPPGSDSEYPSERASGPRSGRYREDEDEEPAADEIAVRRMNTSIAKQVEGVRREVAALRAERYTERVIADLHSRYPDFDESAIRAQLVEMNPEDAKRYHNPVGWETLYLRSKMAGQAETGTEAATLPHAEESRRATSQLPGVKRRKLPQVIDKSDRQASVDAALEIDRLTKGG